MKKEILNIEILPCEEINFTTHNDEDLVCPFSGAIGILEFEKKIIECCSFIYREANFLMHNSDIKNLNEEEIIKLAKEKIDEIKNHTFSLFISSHWKEEIIEHFVDAVNIRIEALWEEINKNEDVNLINKKIIH